MLMDNVCTAKRRHILMQSLQLVLRCYYCRYHYVIISLSLHYLHYFDEHRDQLCRYRTTYHTTT